MKKYENKTFDELPDGRLKKGDHVREVVDNSETDLVETRMQLAEKWIADRKACVKVDAHELAALLKQYGSELLRSRAVPRFCPDCAGLLKFDPNVVGDTVGGLTLRGWDVCTAAGCGKGWLSDLGVPDAGEWKLAAGGRSIETGSGRIRIDGGTDVETLIARIVKLPELELEIARLRTYREEQEELVKESETVPPLDPEASGAPCKVCGKPVGDPLHQVDPDGDDGDHAYEPTVVPPHGEASPWRECKLVVNGIALKDGDRILRINQPEPKDNGVWVIQLERP